MHFVTMAILYDLVCHFLQFCCGQPVFRIITGAIVYYVTGYHLSWGIFLPEFVASFCLVHAFFTCFCYFYSLFVGNQQPFLRFLYIALISVQGNPVCLRSSCRRPEEGVVQSIWLGSSEGGRRWRRISR